MNRLLHNDPRQDITASEGWQDMRLLLDKNLPVKETAAKRRPYFYYFAAASCLLILLLSYLQLQHGKQKISLYYPVTTNKINDDATKNTINLPNTTTATRIDPSVFTDAIAGAKHRLDLQYLADNKNTFMHSNKHTHARPYSFENDPGNSYINDDAAENKNICQADFTRSSSTENINGIPYGNAYMLFDKLKDAGRGEHSFNEHAPVSATSDKSKKKRIHQSSWEFAAGIGLNAAASQHFNGQPYPVAEAKYNISPKFYLLAGISAWSPVNSSSTGIDKTVYVNDTANNFRSYNELSRYTRFHYADIPVMAGVNINKRVSVQGGIQASLLLNKKNLQTFDGYDFQSNSQALATNPSMPGVFSSTAFETVTRKVDYRLIGGMRYTINKFVFNLSYQQAMQSPVHGDKVISGKNKLVSLQVLYRLKK